MRTATDPSSVHPPRVPELILNGLGADSEFSDDVIGDLAEEFALRVRWDGVGDARRWYWRECARVAPYLLRDWRHGRGWRAVLGVADVVALTSVCGIVVEGFTTYTVACAARLLHMWPLASRHVGGFTLPAVMLAWTLADGLFGGYIAARFNRRAPMIAALGLAAVWGLFLLAGVTVLVQPHPPIWYRILNSTTVMAGIVVGAVMGMRGSESERIA